MSRSDEFLKILQIASQEAKFQWWPKFVYHYTDVTNVVNILNCGKLYSRNHPENRMINENAGVEILETTNPEVLNYVRFYFRPKTPTQYRNEGFIPKEKRRYHGSNVPIPVFLAFEAKDILALDDAMFSEIALSGGRKELTNDINRFKNFDFEKIYSDGYYNGENLTPYRRAEVVVHNECDLTYLKNIWCRSHGEYVTLCTMLKEQGIYEKYQNIIGVKEHLDGLFFKHSIYVSKVSLFQKKAVISYENVAIASGCNLNIKYVLCVGNEVIESRTVHRFDTTISYDVPYIQSLIEKNNNEYIFKIYLDDSLLHMSKYSAKISEIDELPF